MALFDKSINALKKNKEQEQNQSLMKLIKRVHSVVENTDIEKHRQSQDYFGALLGNSKEMDITSVDVEGMHGEWVRVNRVHMKKYVILYCHGGGYSTGSCVYARTLTTKLACSTSMDVFCFDYRLAPEYPYPAAMEDAMKAWNYLMVLGYGARDVIVIGDSAGGNMALSLVVKLKEEERLLPRGLVLLSPWSTAEPSPGCSWAGTSHAPFRLSYSAPPSPSPCWYPPGCESGTRRERKSRGSPKNRKTDIKTSRCLAAGSFIIVTDYSHRRRPAPLSPGRASTGIPPRWQW